MPLTPESLRVRIGLTATDASKDTEINLTREQATAIAELYCDRKFKLDHQVETFTHVSGGSVSLIRYPVWGIKTIDGVDFPYHIEPNTGLIHFDGNVHSHEITVNYDGGYILTGIQDPADFLGSPLGWPEDLLMAILGIFDKVWAARGGGTVSSGGIKTVRAGDLSVTYDNSAGASSGGSSAFGGLIPPMAAAILDMYKREYS